MSRIIGIRLPGDISEAEDIRVDHAGEYAAVNICAGQIAGYGNGPMRAKLEEMLEHEQKHLEYFDAQIKEGRAKATALLPVWHILSYTLGYISGKLNCTMICTHAIEKEICKHYEDQLSRTNPGKLHDAIKEFYLDEKEHMIEAASHMKPGFFAAMATQIIGLGCKIAIALSKRM